MNKRGSCTDLRRKVATLNANQLAELKVRRVAENDQMSMARNLAMNSSWRRLPQLTRRARKEIPTMILLFAFQTTVRDVFMILAFPRYAKGRAVILGQGKAPDDALRAAAIQIPELEAKETLEAIR